MPILCVIHKIFLTVVTWYAIINIWMSLPRSAWQSLYGADHKHPTSLFNRAVARLITLHALN